MIALDTNILVYAVEQGDKAEAARAVVGKAILTTTILPVQVLAEFANVCRRKLKLLTPAIVARIEEATYLFQVHDSTAADVVAASICAERYQLAFFDALICTVARSAGATFLLSEDMQDGMVIDGLRILDPFDPANAATLAELFAA